MDGSHSVLRITGRRGSRVADQSAKSSDVRPENLGKAVAELEIRMFTHAQSLEFEEAARVRDQINALKERVLKAG